MRAESSPNSFRTESIYLRHHLIKGIRGFFYDNGYLEVDTPILVRCPGIDPYIDAVKADKDKYLATSPELLMKRLLGILSYPMSGGREVKESNPAIKIFQITHGFRSAEIGNYHNPEFTILEWYQSQANYEDIMDETENLIKKMDEVIAHHTQRNLLFDLAFPRFSVDEVFAKYAGWKPSEKWEEDRFFLNLIELVEPALANLPAFFLYDFPAQLASLARLKPENLRVSERFEMYIKGVEIANAFTELVSYPEQEARFKRDLSKRQSQGKEVYPIDHRFLDTLKEGLPPCAGIALGVDRLLMTLCERNSLGQIMPFTVDRL
ncbi:MAG: amino acid--tRNA ligase-related protein [bacterium]